NADVRKCRSNNCAPAPAKNKPERPEKLRAVLFHFFLPIDRVTIPLRIVDQFLGIYFCLVSAVFEFAVPHPDYRTRSKTKNGALTQKQRNQALIRTSFSWEVLYRDRE